MSGIPNAFQGLAVEATLKQQQLGLPQVEPRSRLTVAAVVGVLQM